MSLKWNVWNVYLNIFDKEALLIAIDITGIKYMHFNSNFIFQFRFEMFK